MAKKAKKVKVPPSQSCWRHFYQIEHVYWQLLKTLFKNRLSRFFARCPEKIHTYIGVMYSTDIIITPELAKPSHLCVMCFFNGQLSKVCGNKWFINTILWLQGVNWAWTNDRKMVVLPTFHLKSLPEILILLPLAPFTMHGNTLMTIKNQKSIGQKKFKTQP